MFLLNDEVIERGKKNMTTLSAEKRQDLTNAYINSILDGMDYSSMEEFIADALEKNLSEYNDEQFITEINDYYPDLLENV